MIKSMTDINTRTHDGRLALALLAVVTTTTHQSKTPDDVIESVQPLISRMFEGEPDVVDGLSTADLVTELRTREDVQSIAVDYREPYHVAANSYDNLNDTGPAIILVVTD